ncbi:cytochrome P450 4C1-like [Prorops nasuta]|uniref:cytochrome P450 4C1-like n=1 Tax=Prorops nasuta TaxID=863751 RepID=UPI0034CF530D
MSLLAYIIILLSTIILSAIIYDCIYTISLYKKTRNLPGPKKLPFIGSLHCLLAGRLEDFLSNVMRITSLYQSPFKFWLGTRLLIIVTEAEQIKTVLSSPKAIEKNDMYKFFRPWMGSGLFTAEGAKWKLHRKLITPTFNLKILESFVEIFAKKANILVKRMEMELDGKEFEISKYIARCTLDFICETAMGINIDAQEGNLKHAESSREVFDIIFKRVLQIWLHPDIIFNNTKAGKRQHELITYLHSITDEASVLLFLTDSKLKGCDNIADKNNKMFLDHLIELTKDGNKFTDQEIREEIDTMLLAGSDTSANVNMFTLLMLACHPEIQEKVYQELYDIYGSSDPVVDPVKSEDLQRMDYLERVIKESMRLFPVAPLIFRRLTGDIVLDDGTILPSGSSIGIIIYKVHRDEKYWNEPLKFDPDRFLPVNSVNRHPYTYIPFSGGSRNCLGMRYAMMSMKVLIATILRTYALRKDEIIPISSIKLKFQIILRPVKPVTIRIEKRICR